MMKILMHRKKNPRTQDGRKPNRKPVTEPVSILHAQNRFGRKPVWSKTGFKQNRFQPKPVFAIGANRFHFIFEENAKAHLVLVTEAIPIRSPWSSVKPGRNRKGRNLTRVEP